MGAQTGNGRGRTARLVAVAVVLSLVAGACSGGGSDGEADGPAAPDITQDAPFRAAGSINAAYVLDAPPASQLLLADDDGTQVASATSDGLGSVVFYDVDPGVGYTVRQQAGEEVLGTQPFEVLAPGNTPDATLYDQEMTEGLNYVRMRDGVELAMTVRLPAGATMADAPFPTLIEYSGYQTAAPHDLLGDITARLADPDLPNDPLVPSTSTVVGSLIAPMLGFASVSVQMRGSGCSGGAFDLFDYPTTYDGYDMVETIAAQDWVQGHQVGMVGLSFSGLSQLFAGGTRPPSLAAVAPMSVADDLYRNVGWPGGIYNEGFAQSWLEERIDDAQAAPEGGQPWAKQLVADGDEHCIENQKLHGQARDVFAIMNEDPSRVPALYDHRSPQRWAADIDAPVFLAGAFQDEQIIGTGQQLVAGLEDNPDTWVTLMNGTHVDPLGPAVFTRWVEFLWLFVAEEIPVIPDTVLGLGTSLYQEIAGAGALPIEQSRFAGQTDVEAAKAQFRQDPRVRVLMDVGGGDLGPGALQPVWELALDAWPASSTQTQVYFLGPTGGLTILRPEGDGSDMYTPDPSARPALSLVDGSAWAAQPNYAWEPVADGKGLGYVSAPLTEDVVIAGASTVELMVESSAAETDLQVTLSEVRPDGDENYVQFGALRSSYRELDAASSDTETIPTYTSSGKTGLAPRKFTSVKVPLFPVAYAFRAGSRLRLTVQAPGGERPAWQFRTFENGSTTNTVSTSPSAPSKLYLPVLPGQTAGGPLPACGALRGTPCRRYVPAVNGG